MRRLLHLICAIFVLALAAGPAFAVESVRVPIDARAIDLTRAIDRYSGQGDRLQVSTAPGADGIVRRIEVSARETGTQPSWIVFALTNDSNEQFDRLIVAPHFMLAGSGVVWPDLGSSRIAAITTSQGFPPEREEVAGADVFRLTLDPGATVTYVAELRTLDLPQIYLWEPEAYRDKVANLTLYKGIVIGVAGLLALFLTIVFVVKGAVIFPAAAALAWAVLAYVCIDFGFWNKLFGIEGEADRVWRAGAEAILAATLLVFLFAYLNLNRWHVRASHVAAVWLAFLVALDALAVFDAPVAAGVARISLAAIAGAGFALVLYLALHGVERAVMLMPTWFLLLLWLTAGGFTVTGTLNHDLVAPALLGGLVLIVMLIGFTVMQNAFAGAGLSHGAVSDGERRALALVGSGDFVFDWDVTSDRIYVSPEAEYSLGLRRGALEGPAAGWLEVLHPFDRDRYSSCLDTILEQRRGRINLDFRLRSSDGHYLWYFLKARPVVGADGEVIRVVGTLSDITESRTAEERMLHDAVRDHLTGLPNREIFFDRLDTALDIARANREERSTVISIDIDRFRQVNDLVGRPGGDSILLTIARRLLRLLQTQDTLARITSDEFAMIVRSERDPQAIIAIAEAIRRTLLTPITFNDREVSITASIGIALFDPNLHQQRDDMLKDAQIATARAKRSGGNRVEFFRAAMRTQHSDRLSLQADLQRAMDRGEISLTFRPVVRLEDRTIAGFEAMMRWDHPRFGRLTPADFVPIAEDSGLIVDLTLFALERTARELAAWQGSLDVHPPIFASVDLTSRRLLRHDLLHEVKGVITRSGVLPGTLLLEISERLIMENPEYCVQILERIREIGAGVCLDEFGAGQSSFAYLQRFPCDIVKLDRTFVRSDAAGARPPILRSLISLAHDLGMEVIAEGAETESDTIELFQLGSEFAQGYAFGNPLSAAEARRLVGAVSELPETRVAS